MLKVQSKIRIWYKYKMTKILIVKLREQRYKEYVLKHERFSDAWRNIKERPRVEIHLNSLGYDRFQRMTTMYYRSNQNSQIARIFRLIDPLVEVIYVSPFVIPLQTLSYYINIMEIIGIPNVTERIHFVTPEHCEIFKNNKMNLADMLYYSPRAMNQI